MNAQVATATGTTWKVEHSWEATTLDYLNPIWYVTGEGFETEEAAKAFEAERVAANKGEMIAHRVVRVPSQAERDVFLEAEFEANRQYWAGQAAEARRIEEARQALFALKGQRVVVTKGRKVPVGTEGVVFWVGEGQWGWRVGFKDDQDNTHWTATSNVEAMAVTEGVAA